MMIPVLTPALTAIIDYATALRDGSDSAIDDAGYVADALFDMLDRHEPDFDELPPAINRTALSAEERDIYNYLRTAYLSLINARP